MQVILLTSIREHQADVEKLLQQSGISVYSFGEITGVHTNQPVNLSDAWFSAGIEKVDALFFFSITTAALATSVMEKVKRFNDDVHAAFPIRSFLIPLAESQP